MGFKVEGMFGDTFSDGRVKSEEVDVGGAVADLGDVQVSTEPVGSWAREWSAWVDF